MLSWLKKRSKPTHGLRREALLTAIPIKNNLVKETPIHPNKNKLGETTLRLTAPRQPRPLARLFATPKTPNEKSFDLDQLGAFVWQKIDGKQTTEQLIQSFAKENRVNPREAEIAVLTFLQTLIKRNLVALAVPKV